MPKATSSPESGPDRDPDDHDDLLDSIELVRYAQGGELNAYAELFARYYPRVKALVRKRLGAKMRGEMDSEDLLQEAMLDAIKGFEGFEVRTRQELIGWFAKIVENSIRSADRYLHAQKRDRSKEVPLQYIATYMEESTASFQPPAKGPGPAELSAEEEQLRILELCLRELEPDQQRVIELRHRKALSWTQVAEAMERPSADAARMLYARARIELQKALRRHGAGPDSSSMGPVAAHGD